VKPHALAAGEAVDKNQRRAAAGVLDREFDTADGNSAATLQSNVLPI